MHNQKRVKILDLLVLVTLNDDRPTST